MSNLHYLDQLPSWKLLQPAALTPEAFSAFGSVISCPLADGINKMPDPVPSDSGAPGIPSPVVANQSTALRYSPISTCDDTYGSQCKSGSPSSPRISLFACFPRELSVREESGKKHLEIRNLERHPHTTQTFVPMALEKRAYSLRTDSPPSSWLDEEESSYLVVVAPTLKNKTFVADPGFTQENQEALQDPPDLENLHAFIAHGGQSVTYGTGTWHAPMIVLGDKRVDFVVFQFVNGVGDEDCQEVALKKGLSVELGDGVAKREPPSR